MDRDKPTIVVVDDAAEVRLLVRTRLRLSGAVRVVGEGADGSEAVVQAHEHQPDLMLLDVSMPGMDGLEAVTRVREVSPNTHVVLYTGFEEEGLGEEAKRLGAAGFIEKSLPIDALVDRLLDHLRSGGEPLLDGDGAVPAGGQPSDQAVLDEHLERFREVFEQAAIGMATLTLTGHLVRVNRAFAATVRRSASDLVGTRYAELTDGRGDEVASALERVRSRPQDVVPLQHGLTGSRERRHMRATLAAVRDSADRALYVFLQIQDVTSEYAAVEELRKSEERFRLLVEVVEDYAIFMLSPEGIIISWNAGAQRSKGYTAEEIVGKHFRVFYPPEQQRARHPEHELEIALRQGHYDEEGWRVRKDGTMFWAYVVITAVFDPTGRHLGFTKVTRDDTQRRKAEEGLRQSEERFRMLVEAVQDYAIFMLDPTGHVMSWNGGAQRIKGYTADEIIGRHFRVFYPPEVQARKHPEYELQEALTHGHYEEEGWRIRKDGSRFWANVLITAIFGSAGDLVGFAKVTRDTTERRRLEEERERAVEALGRANTELEAVNVRLQQAVEDQSEFLAVTAHELRTPIGVLAGSAATLSRHAEELTEEERSDLLDGMLTSTSRLRRLLADLLTAARLQASALELRTEQVPLSDVIADSVTTVRRSHQDAQILVDVPPGLSVTADRDRIGQALDNLLGNALRHGEPPVRITGSSDPSWVRIRVGDSGTGVPEAMLPRLFDRFATGKHKGGTGLGLFIVQQLARAHGGDAYYEPPSEQARAGAFVIKLPR